VQGRGKDRGCVGLGSGEGERRMSVRRMHSWMCLKRSSHMNLASSSIITA
jgi:hypothetical protein